MSQLSLLPSPYPRTSLRIALIVSAIAFSIGLFLIGSATAIFANRGLASLRELGPMMIFYGVWAWLIAALAPCLALVERYFTNLAQVKWGRLAEELGLTEHPDRVAESDLEPFLDLPMFRFVDPDNNQADSLVQGVIGGHTVMVMQLRYAFVYSTMTGLRTYRGQVQTIALVRGVAGLPDFHLAPEANPWDRIEPDWPRELRLGRVVRALNEYSFDRLLIRGRDVESVARLFSDERVRMLGELGGWTIECHNGNLLVYRHGRKTSVDKLPYLIGRVVDIVSVLTEPLEDSPAAAAPLAGIQIALPRRGKDGSFRLSRAEDRLIERESSGRKDECTPDAPE